MSQQQVYEFYGRATGEVRDAEGRLLDGQGNVVPEGTAQVTGITTDPILTVPLSALAAMSDDELRAKGVDDPTITDIRSRISEQENHE